jgi:crotonobetainyl-CoA hydratase
MMSSSRFTDPNVNRSDVLTEKIGQVLLVTLNRPEVRNAVNLSLATRLGDVLTEANENPDVWVVVVTGAGDQAFCAGADLKSIAAGERLTPADPKRAAWGFAGYVSHHISKPTIAAVNGFALGGGTEIALASDLIAAADNALFGLPEVKRGIYPAAGGAFRLPNQIPKKIAMEMILTGTPISAQRALELGLINRVVPLPMLLDTALELAQQICKNAPLAVQASKRIANGIRDGRIASEGESWMISASEGRAVMRSNDAKEGSSAFAGRRTPNWKAR